MGYKWREAIYLLEVALRDVRDRSETEETSALAQIYVKIQVLLKELFSYKKNLLAYTFFLSYLQMVKNTL